MRALSICQPWAELIARGVKRVENRSWRISEKRRLAYRGRMLVHAGKSKDWLIGCAPLMRIHGIDAPGTGAHQRRRAG